MLARTSSASDISEPLAVWAECDHRARLVLDDHMGIMWTNRAAAGFIQEVDLFVPGPGPLTLREHGRHEVFRSFIRASSAAISSLCVPLGEDDHVLCTAINLIDGDRHRATGLTLRRSGGVSCVGAGDLKSAFRLTPAERRVAETLFAGRTAKQIGVEQRLSIATVRVHIRHIYRKLDVRSREAMFHKLLPFMLVR